jgi:hypothetical protein
MKRLVHVLLVCSVFPVAAVAVAAEDKLVETPYYPLQVGTTWHYKAGDGKFTIRVTRHEKVGDVLCARLEATRDGKVIAWQHLSVTADGVYRHDLTDQHTGTAVTQSPRPPMLVLKLPPKSGETWKVDSRADGKTFRGSFKIDEQEVKIPAGAFKAVRVTSQDLEINGLKPVITTYFASGAGMVKQTIQEGDSKIEIELEKLETAK